MASSLLPLFPEGSLFHSYHAFESVACAALAAQSLDIPEPHKVKIERFLSTFHQHQFALGGASLAFRLHNVRDEALYPRSRGVQAVTKHPGERWTPAQAEDLLRRVRGIVRAIVRELDLPT